MSQREIPPCLALLAAGTLFAFPAHARTIHVAVQGSDAEGKGDAGSPYATLVKAGEQTKPGDVVLVHGGTYLKTYAKITVRGEKDRPVTFMPAPGEHVVLDGKGSAESPEFEAENKDSVPGVLDIRNSRHAVFDGFEVAHSPGYGISLWESEHITVKNCVIHHTWSRGLGGTGAHLVFENNTIHDVVLQNENEKIFEDTAKGKIGFWSSAAATWYREGGRPSQDVTWRKNSIYRSWGEGLNALHVDGAVLTGNTIKNAYSVLIYVDHSRNVTVDGNYLVNTTSTYTRRDTRDLAAGILMASEHYKKAAPMMLENVTITNNIISNVSVGIGFWRDPANKDPLNKYRGVLIAHNLIEPAGVGAIKMAEINEPSPELSKNLIVNNVLFDGRMAADDQGKATTSIRIQNPELWTLSGNFFPNGLKGIVGSGFKERAGNKEGNPALLDPRPASPLEAGAYRPKPRSPVLAAGVSFDTVKTDYSGVRRSNKRPTPGPFESPQTN